MATGRLLATAILLTAANLPALDPNRSLTQYQSRLWQAEDGLPRNNVRALALRPDGQILVAASGGVATFDGARFHRVATREDLADSGERVQSVLATRDGAIWIGMQSGGLVVLRGSSFRRITPADGLVGWVIQGLYQDESGAVWVGTESASCRIAETVHCLPGSESTPRTWNRFVDDNAGGVLIATASGLLRWEKGTTTRLQQTGSGEEVRSLFRGRDHRLWMGGLHGLYRVELSRETSRVVLKKVAGVPGPVVAMADDRAGSLWISSFGDGMYRLNARGLEHDRALPDKFITTLLVDRADNLWLGFRSEGLMRRTDGEFVPYGTPEGFSSPFALVVHEDALGTLWLGAMDGGLRRFQNGRLTAAGLPPEVAHFSVYAIASDPEGGLWLGNYGDGLYHLANGKLTRWDARNNAAGRYVLVLLLDPQGDLWVGSAEAGLSVIPGASSAPGAVRRLLQGESVNSLVVLRSGAVLAGSNVGLTEITGDSSRRIWDGGAVESLSQDSGGRVWAGLRNGRLGLFENGTLRLVPLKAGLQQMPVYAVVDDQRGSLWLATDRGIVRVLLDQLLAVISGARSSLDVAVYGKEDGMRSSEARGQGRPAGWRASNGDLWFATAASFIRRPAQTPADREVPAPVIVDAEVDGRSMAGASRLDLAPETRSLTVRFGSVRFSNPHQVRYRYQLEGYDRNWVQDTGEGFARYGPLPAGQLRFLVQARSALGPWNPETAAVEIMHRPNWFQTWWFRGMMVCVLAAVVWGTARWYGRRLRGRFSAVLEERNRISREWHDSLMAGFAAISWQLDATQDRLHQGESEAAAELDTARNMVRHTQAEARRIIWDLRVDLDESASLASRIAKMCERISSVSHVDIKTRTEGVEVRLNTVAAHNLLRIAQEGLQNAVKHAHAGSILVWLRYGADAVTLGVKDDGCGFVNEEARHLYGGHLGILGMNERVRKLGGNLEVRSAPGAGTEVIASVALRNTVEKKTT